MLLWHEPYNLAVYIISFDHPIVERPFIFETSWIAMVRIVFFFLPTTRRQTIFNHMFSR